MRTPIEMDKVLATIEQFIQMVENNEGVELDCSFWVSMDDLYKFAKQEGLEVEDNNMRSEPWGISDFDKWSMWHPIRVNGAANRNLTISLYANE